MSNFLFTNYIHSKQGHMMVHTNTYIFTRVSESESQCLNESVHLYKVYVHACMDTGPLIWPLLNPFIPDSQASVYAHWPLKQLAEEER